MTIKTQTQQIAKIVLDVHTKRRYEKSIRKSQKKIGPYKPVSYTTIYA